MVETVEPSHVRNRFYSWAGLLILILNKIRHELTGYRTPRPFPVSEIERAINYDLRVAAKVQRELADYTQRENGFRGRAVLELAPGDDLGVGLILLWRGARAYYALDLHELAVRAPAELYQELLRRLSASEDHAEGCDDLRRHLQKAVLEGSDRMRYVCRPDFDLSVFQGENIDLVVSNAAFEHFGDVDAVIRQLSDIVNPGAIFLAVIDLQTHTRWIRDADPLNIYRYPSWIYDPLKFSGSPNRLRPRQYEATLCKYGWKDIRLKPLLRLSEPYLARVRPTLDPRYRNPGNEMEVLSFSVAATKA